MYIFPWLTYNSKHIFKEKRSVDNIQKKKSGEQKG